MGSGLWGYPRLERAHAGVPLAIVVTIAFTLPLRTARVWTPAEPDPETKQPTADRNHSAPVPSCSAERANAQTWMGGPFCFKLCVGQVDGRQGGDGSGMGGSSAPLPPIAG